VTDAARPSFAAYRDAYRRMVSEAHYLPGIIEWTEPADPSELEAEADAFAAELLRQDDNREFRVFGTTGFGDQPAIAFLLHAAQAVCAVDYELAGRLIRMAQRELTKARQVAS